MSRTIADAEAELAAAKLRIETLKQALRYARGFVSNFGMSAADQTLAEIDTALGDADVMREDFREDAAERPATP